MTYTYDIFDKEGKKLSSKSLDETLFSDEQVSESLLHEYVVMYLANQRQSTAHTKTRSEIRGSGRKLYRQKGTGNARVGNAASPVRRKGGVVFGPRNERNYTKVMNKKMKKRALLSAIVLKLKSSSVVGLDSFGLDEIKSARAVSTLSSMGLSEKTTLVVGEGLDHVVYKSTRNIQGVTYVTARELNPYELVTHAGVVFVGGAFDQFVSRIS